MTKVQEKSRITACKRILKNAKKHNSYTNSFMEFLKYANTINGIQYVFDGYRIVALKTPLPLEERPDNISLTYDLEAYLQENIDNAKILKIPNKKALKEYIKAYKEKQKSMGIKLVTPPLYNFGRKLPEVRADYLLDMINIFPNGTFYANGQHNVFVEDSEGNRGNLLGIRKMDIYAEATKL